MKIWSNTSILDDFVQEYCFTELKHKAEIVLLGSQPINLVEFPLIKAIFRAGIGRDNVPDKEAETKGIVIRYPSDETINIIFEETARFTCGLIFRMLYGNLGTLDPWVRAPRHQLSKNTLLVIGTGRIGGLVVKLMKPIMHVITFDILRNKISELKPFMQMADCVSIHIPKSDDNVSFINKNKLSWMKSGSVLINTARGVIVDENALYDEIKSGRLRAAFDVYWQEPYAGKLKEFYPEGFFMTPHVASTCSEFLQGCKKDLEKLISELNA